MLNKWIGLAVLIGAGLPNTSVADVAVSVSEFTTSYKSCFIMRDSDNDRLSCYDNLADKVADTARIVAGSISTNCEIEDWNFNTLGKSTVIRGAATCAAGYISFRLYDGDTFLTAGTVGIRGFVFEAIAGVFPPPAEMQMKYVIEAK